MSIQFVSPLLNVYVLVFHMQAHYDLDLHASSANQNLDFLLNKSNHPIKFEGYESNGYLDSEWNGICFHAQGRYLDFDLQASYTCISG